MGGVVAAVAGPNLARWSQSWGPESFTGSFLVLCACSVWRLPPLYGLRFALASC